MILKALIRSADLHSTLDALFLILNSVIVHLSLLDVTSVRLQLYLFHNLALAEHSLYTFPLIVGQFERRTDFIEPLSND